MVSHFLSYFDGCDKQVMIMVVRRLCSKFQEEDKPVLNSDWLVLFQHLSCIFPCVGMLYPEIKYSAYLGCRSF